MNTFPRQAPYDEDTETLQVDPAASFDAAASFLPIHTGPACAGTSLDWVPDIEHPVVPAALQRICRGCPVRPACLTAAVSNEVDGYWAGTTRDDRHQLASGLVTVAAAEWLQLLAVARVTLAPACEQATALHPAETAGYSWYRRGCRCPGCRAGNAARGRQDKARARAKRQAVAA